MVLVVTIPERVAGYILTPYQSVESFVAASTAVIVAVTSLQSKTGWLYILTSFTIGALVYRAGRQRGWIHSDSCLSFLFPRDVYLHRSALLDYKYVAIELTLNAFIYVPIASGLSVLLYHGVSRLTGDLSLLRPYVMQLIAGTIAAPIIALLIADFVAYYTHYLMHKIPELWVFHQVHHAAEVLTPVTVWREHPIWLVVGAMLNSSFAGIGSVLYTAQTGMEVALPVFLGVNIVQFLFYAFASQLRHSHVWLSYGPVLSWIVISPAQHQIHHSIDPKHYDKNFGYIFAFWDALFGSLYVPKNREILQFGLVGVEHQDFTTVPRLYFRPFKRAAQLLRQRIRQWEWKSPVAAGGSGL